jgi:hypothetical protein
MRQWVVRAALAGLAAASAVCIAACSAPNPPGIALARVDPEDAAERGVIGGVVGATTGAGLGAIVAINPALGAWIGAAAGAPIGAAIGVATAQPLPAYKPIAVPVAAVIPHFYDNWPPGYQMPSIAGQTPPPPPPPPG